jgi:hypothetical protein
MWSAIEPRRLVLRSIGIEMSVLRPGGGADQPAPVQYGDVAVAAPLGRAVAMTWNTSGTGLGPTQALSVWRP